MAPKVLFDQNDEAISEIIDDYGNKRYVRMLT